MGKDHYQTLGVSRNATDAEIKKAYRKLALKWHPDKNPDNQEVAQEKFQEVGNAFNVLSDPEKKKMYDQFGEAGENMEAPPGGGASGFPGGMGGMGGMGGGGQTFHFTSGGGGGGGGFDANDIFKSFFGTSDPFAAGGGGDDPFASMGGGGGFSSFGMGGMGGMGGRGMGGMGGRGGMGGGQRPLRKSEPISYDLGVNLDDLYTGKLKKVRITKKVEVNGQIEQRKVDKEIHIKPGWKDGTKITFEKAGDELPGIEPADIIFVLRTRPHDFFERDGDDLIYNCPITLQQALCGFSTSVRTLDDRVLPIHEKSVTPQTVKVISGEGMPNQKTKAKGNMKVKYSIQFPTNLSQNKRNRIGEILSSP